MAMLALFGRLLAHATDGSRTSTGLAGAASAGAGAYRAETLPGVARNHDVPRLGLARALVAAMLVQVALGGLVSAHFAGMACLGDPSCRVGVGGSWSIAEWSPLRAPTDPWLRSVGQAAAMATLESAHRIVAAAVTVLALFVATQGARAPAAIRRPCRTLGGLALVQVLVGITIVTFALPLAGVMAHNAVAALMLFAAAVVTARVSMRYRTTRALPAEPPAATPAGKLREAMSVSPPRAAHRA
jgi:cytochrome c oxidase assembly protein subunit 15